MPEFVTDRISDNRQTDQREERLAAAAFFWLCKQESALTPTGFANVEAIQQL